MTHPTHDETRIREAAYLLWLDEGKPAGRDQEHWQKAVAALSTAKADAKPARKAPAKPRTAKAKTAAPKTKAAAKPKAAPATAAKKPRAAKAAKTAEV